MHLVRCKDQASKTLEKFYSHLAHEGHALGEGAKAMLDLIERLRSLPDSRQFFGLTSHARLVLLAEDDYRSPWFVVISALNKQNYHIEYLMPASIAPWPNAYVRGEFSSEDEAIQRIQTAVQR